MEGGGIRRENGHRQRHRGTRVWGLHQGQRQWSRVAESACETGSEEEEEMVRNEAGQAEHSLAAQM